MTQISEHLVELIFKKLKSYKKKKIFLEKKFLNKFILSLFKEKWIQFILYLTAIVKLIFKYIYIDMDNFSSLTIILAIVFIVSLYFLLKVTSNTKN